jgi:hypothetical protein
VIFLFLGLLIIAAPGAVHAQVSWTGGGDGTSWNDAANWSPQTVPGAGDDVVIDRSTSDAYTVRLSSSRTVGSLRLDSRDATLELGASLTVNGAYTHSFSTLTGSSDLNVEGKITWNSGTMAGSGTTTAGGGLELTDDVTLDAHRLVVPAGQTAVHTVGGWDTVDGGNGAVLEIESGAVFDIRESGDFEVFDGSSSPPKIVNRGTLKKTAGNGDVQVHWRLENQGTVEGAHDLLCFRGAITDEDGTYRATGAKLSLRPDLDDVTFRSGSRIEADSAGTVNFGRGNWTRGPDTSSHTIEGTIDVEGTTTIRGKDRVSVTIAQSADVQSLGGVALRVGGSDGHLTVDATDPLAVGRLTMGREGRLFVRSELTVQGPMLMDHTSAHFESAHDLVVEGSFTWNGGRMSGRAATIAQGGLELAAGYGSASHNNYLDGRRLVLPSGASGSYPGSITEGGNGAVFEIQSGAAFKVQDVGDFGVFSGSSSPPKIVNRGTITKTADSRMRVRWALENRGTVTVEDGNVQLEGSITDESGTYRATTGNSRFTFRPDSGVTFGPNSTITALSDAQLTYESDAEFVSHGTIDVDGDFDLRADSGATFGAGSTLQVGPEAQLTYESNQALTSRGAFELEGFLVAHQRASRTDPATVRLLSGGELRGAGTVTIGTVANDSGLVRPGGDGTAGLLNIQGDYHQGDSAALELELGGTTSGEDYDRLDAEDAQLGGTLRLDLIDDFTPSEDDLLQPLQWSGTRSGSFSEVQGQQTGGVLLAVEYGSEALRVFDGSLPEPPDPPNISVEMQAPPFARVGQDVSMTARAVNKSNQILLHSVDKLGGTKIDESLFGDCPQDDNYENLKCRLGRFGVVPPPPPEGESYPRLTTEPLFSSGGSASSSSTGRQASQKAMTTTRMAFFNGSGPVAKEISKSCEREGEKKTAEINLGNEQVTDADLERCALEAASLVLSVVPGADCVKLGAGVTLNVAKGFYTGSFDLPAYIASQTLQASKCTGDFAGFGTALQIMNELNKLKTRGGAIKKTVDSCVPDPSKVADGSDQASTTCLAAIDPNDKKGPPGVGAERHTPMQDSLPYTVFFENKPEATAPAQQVTISDTLAATHFDLASFSFGAVAFGDTSVAVPEDTVAFSKDVDLRPGRDLILRIEGALDTTSSVLTWTFTSLDPSTMEPTDDPTAGFLPPNDNPPEGEGSVSYFADLEDSLSSGASFGKAAQIVFDENDPIDTPVWSNTLDREPPTSQVEPLAEMQDSARFEVQWSGTDAGSGIGGYDIYVSKDDGEFNPWLEDTLTTSAVYEGERGSDYAFYSVARDRLGHTEAAPDSPDTETTALPVELVSFEATASGGESARLTWQTTSETNNAGFEVQRRAGERGSWTEVGFVESKAAGGTTSEAMSYQFEDADLPYAADKLAYRLRQVDVDGSESLSDRVTIQRTVDEVELLGTFPNPARAQTTVQFAVPGQQKVALKLYDVMGREVRTLARGPQEGRTEMQVGLSGLPSGIYFLRLQAGGTTKTKKMTVVR